MARRRRSYVICLPYQTIPSHSQNRASKRSDISGLKDEGLRLREVHSEDGKRRTSPRIHIRMSDRIRLLVKRAEEVFTNRGCGGRLAVRCEQGLSLLLRGYGLLGRDAVRMSTSVSCGAYVFRMILTSEDDDGDGDGDEDGGGEGG